MLHTTYTVTTALIHSKGLRVGPLTVGECGMCTAVRSFCEEHTQSTSSLHNLLYTHKTIQDRPVNECWTLIKVAGLTFHFAKYAYSMHTTMHIVNTYIPQSYTSMHLNV